MRNCRGLSGGFGKQSFTKAGSVFRVSNTAVFGDGNRGALWPLPRSL